MILFFIGVARSEEKNHLIVDQDVCERLVSSKGAAYTPGRDVYGRAVAPADLEQPGAFDLKTLTIPLSIDPSPYAGGGVSALSDTIGLGTVELDILTGKISLNGKAMSDTDLLSVQQACEDAM